MGGASSVLQADDATGMTWLDGWIGTSVAKGARAPGSSDVGFGEGTAGFRTGIFPASTVVLSDSNAYGGDGGPGSGSEHSDDEVVMPERCDKCYAKLTVCICQARQPAQAPKSMAVATVAIEPTDGGGGSHSDDSDDGGMSMSDRCSTCYAKLAVCICPPTVQTPTPTVVAEPTDGGGGSHSDDSDDGGMSMSDRCSTCYAKLAVCICPPMAAAVITIGANVSEA
jgi:hypothetical protein